MSIRWVTLFGLAVVAAASCTDDGAPKAEARGGTGGSSRGGSASGGAGARGGAGSGQGGAVAHGGGPHCVAGQADGIALAVADLEESELSLEGLAFFAYEERYSFARARRDGGWLVGAYRGFWDVGDDGSRPFVAIDVEDAGDTYRFLVGDLDGNGTEDVISTHSHSEGGAAGSIVVVWQRLPDGTLERRFDFGHNNNEDEPMALGDFDADGDRDILALRLRAPIAYRHDGNFGFEEVDMGPRLPLSHANGEVLYVAFYDADADARDDIVAVRHRNDGTDETFVATFGGDGMGEFSEGLISVVGEFSPSFVQGGHDLTGDGVFDLLTIEDAGNSEYQMTVVEGSTDGGFRPLEQRVLDVSSVTLADVNADGTADVLSPAPEGLRVELALGGGAFASPRTHRTPLGPTGPVAAFRTVAGDPLRVGLTFQMACSPPCGDSCGGSCFAGRCLECSSSTQCAGGLCVRGRCETCTSACGGAGGESGAAGSGN